MDSRVVVEAAVPVYDVQSANEAVRIAISKTGEMLNPDLNYVEIEMGERHCSHCGDQVEPAFVAADESLVALELEMLVFNVERDEHAARIARKEIGQRLENIPLEVLSVEAVEEEEESDQTDGEETDSAGETDSETGDSNAGDSGTRDSETPATEEPESSAQADEESVMPGVDEMLEDESRDEAADDR